MLTQERLKKLLSYNPETGVFIWIYRRSGGRELFSRAGKLSQEKRIVIQVDNKEYLAHRLAFFYMTGEFPKYEVDHINGDPTDNRWGNLRDVRGITNIQNQRRARVNNKLGIQGVSLRKGRFRAQIKNMGKSHEIGVFDTPEQAHLAYLEAKRRLHPGFTL